VILSAEPGRLGRFEDTGLVSSPARIDRETVTKLASTLTSRQRRAPSSPSRSPVVAAMMKSDASWSLIRRHSHSVSTVFIAERI